MRDIDDGDIAFDTERDDHLTGDCRESCSYCRAERARAAKPTVTRKTVHLVLDVEGASRWPDWRLRDLLATDKGEPVSAEDARAYLREQIEQGVRVMPLGEPCEGFDPVTGCPGHPVEEGDA